MSYRVFLGLGSNLGERHKFLSRAVHGLKQLKDVKIIWTSSIYETEPYGRKEQPGFLNAVVELETTLAPPDLFDNIKAIEQNVGRTSTERWGPREIDIDILVYDGVVFDGKNVNVPHPELEKRRFVLVPLAEVAPDLVHPVSGLTMEELAASCPDRGRVVKSYHRIVL
jgi:2-amino-4-hydroxy-6-hydroxymethyldihydropteridine diphosphokinase